jgi:hypothetical protein
MVVKMWIVVKVLMPYSLVDGYQQFKDKYHLHPQSRRWKQCVTLVTTYKHASHSLSAEYEMA